MSTIRTGFGYDVHRFGGSGPVVLCGVEIGHDRGIIATSDGDVAAHAVADAILGAAVIGDLGTEYPSDSPESQGANSLAMVSRCMVKAQDRGFEVSGVDVTIVAQDVRIAPHRDAMRQKLADALHIAVGQVSVKGKTTDGLGFIGAGEGLAAHAVVTLQR